jgi:hypothetical protein
MRLTRKEDLSVYLYIKENLVNPQYCELTTAATLTQDGTKWVLEYPEELTELKIVPFARNGFTGAGRGIPYFDFSDSGSDFSTEQTTNITVYNGVTPITGYTTNYIYGYVETDQDLTGCTADYQWCLASVVDEFPHENITGTPVISIENVTGHTSPLQLGIGEIRNADWNLQIFASNKGERDDLLDIIFDGLHNKRCPIYDLSGGLPLLKSGFFNTNFSTTLVPAYSSLFFSNTKRTLTGLPSWGFYSTEKFNRYRGQITFNTEVFKF